MPQEYDPTDLIWLVEAAKVYKRSRTYMEGLIEPGPKGEPPVLSYIKLPGDVRYYLLKSELERFFKGQIIRGQLYRAGIEDSDEGDSGSQVG